MQCDCDPQYLNIQYIQCYQLVQAKNAESIEYFETMNSYGVLANTNNATHQTTMSLPHKKLWRYVIISPTFIQWNK